MNRVKGLLLFLCTIVAVTACGGRGNESPTRQSGTGEGEVAAGANGSAVANETWARNECKPYNGPNPTLDEAREYVREWVAASSPGTSIDSVPVDWLDDLTRPEQKYTGLSGIGHGFQYSEISSGAIAWLTAHDCSDFDPDKRDPLNPWGPRVHIGEEIVHAVHICDGAKDKTRESNDFADELPLVCPQYA